MAGMGGGGLGESQYADAAMYVGTRSKLSDLMRSSSREDCTDVDTLRVETEKLKDRGFLTEQQLEAVDFEMLMAFFNSPMGQKLRSGVQYIREFKFSILDEGSRYDPVLQEEQVLLQGVVDCAILEQDGIIVLDFKTDYVTEATLSETIERYRTQVAVYANALQRIYEMPVKESYLYFFRLKQLIKL